MQVQNDGVYADDTDTDIANGVAGNTIVSMLPSGAELDNPFTKVANVPRASGAAAAVGETGYEALDPDSDGVNDGYEITGWGKQANIITLSSGS